MCIASIMITLEAAINQRASERNMNIGPITVGFGCGDSAWVFESPNGNTCRKQFFCTQYFPMDVGFSWSDMDSILDTLAANE